MKSLLVLCGGLLFAVPSFSAGESNHSSINSNQEANMQTAQGDKNNAQTSSAPRKSRERQILIDKFVVPEAAKEEFVRRMNYNRNFLRTLQGFVRDEVYSKTDESGTLTCVTIAVWENEDVVAKAKEAVQTEYKRIGFDTAEFVQRMKIQMERDFYQEMTN